MNEFIQDFSSGSTIFLLGSASGIPLIFLLGFPSAIVYELLARILPSVSS